MTCPECGARTFEDFTVTLVGDDEWPLEIHTHRCVICGWVTVQDWQWIEDDEGGDDANPA
jgi:hypothetical protein